MKTIKKTKKTTKDKVVKKAKISKHTKSTDKTTNVDQEPQDEQETESIKTLESNVDTSFFYTNDKFINSFDNVEIIAAIQNRYKNLNEQNSDSVIKKEIVHFLDDEKFVEHILNFYNITIFDLFKIIYKQYSSIFKGPYLKKIRKTLSDKKYARVEGRKAKM